MCFAAATSITLNESFAGTKIYFAEVISADKIQQN